MYYRKYRVRNFLKGIYMYYRKYHICDYLKGIYMYYRKYRVRNFLNGIRHLTLFQQRMCNDLIDLYFQAEYKFPLKIDSIYNMVYTDSVEEVTVLEKTLNEFFAETPGGPYQKGCEKQLARMINKYRGLNENIFMLLGYPQKDKSSKNENTVPTNNNESLLKELEIKSNEHTKIIMDFLEAWELKNL